MFIVYVLRSEEGLRYIGQTANLTQRLEAHNLGLSKWTKRGTNWKLVHMEEYDTRSEAMKREKCLKTGKGREELDLLLE